MRECAVGPSAAPGAVWFVERPGMDIFIETRIFDAYLSKKKYQEKKE